MDTLGRIILSIIERLSSFRGKNVLPLYRLVHWKVSFIQRCPLFRVSFIRGSTVLSNVHVHVYTYYMYILCKSLYKDGTLCVWRSNSTQHHYIRGTTTTHYLAESLSWYSLDLLKQSCTPGSVHNLFIAARSPGENGSVSACRAVIPNNNMASSWWRNIKGLMVLYL